MAGSAFHGPRSRASRNEPPPRQRMATVGAFGLASSRTTTRCAGARAGRRDASASKPRTKDGWLTSSGRMILIATSRPTEGCSAEDDASRPADLLARLVASNGRPNATAGTGGAAGRSEARELRGEPVERSWKTCAGLPMPLNRYSPSALACQPASPAASAACASAERAPARHGPRRDPPVEHGAEVVVAALDLSDVDRHPRAAGRPRASRPRPARAGSPRRPRRLRRRRRRPCRSRRRRV